MQKVLFILGEMSDDDIDWMIESGTREPVAAGDILIHDWARALAYSMA